MTVLSKLNLSDKTKAAMLASPEAKLRGKTLEAPDLQIEAAKVMRNGAAFMRRAMRWLDDPETGRAGPARTCPFIIRAIRSRALAGRLAFDRGAPARTPRDQSSVLLVVWVSGSLSIRARNLLTRPSTRPPESLITEAYSERSVSAMEMP